MGHVNFAWDTWAYSVLSVLQHEMPFDHMQNTFEIRELSCYYREHNAILVAVWSHSIATLTKQYWQQRGMSTLC